MRVWKLDHGVYEVITGPDTDGDDKSDDRATRGMELSRHSLVPITLQPECSTVVEVRQRERLEPIVSRADVAISDRDIEKTGDGQVRVTVHNIGAAVARAISIEALDEAGKVVGRGAVDRLDPPADLKPKVATVTLECSGAPATIVLDRQNRISEICEENNSAPVGSPRGRFTYLR